MDQPDALGAPPQRAAAASRPRWAHRGHGGSEGCGGCGGSGGSGGSGGVRRCAGALALATGPGRSHARHARHPCHAQHARCAHDDRPHAHRSLPECVSVRAARRWPCPCRPCPRR
ncbi:MAG: hypothetical protein C0513_09105 [Isosphaera sp.]|nr:hypothetical protein [Isosphaera sp.]